ncbi:rhophilin-2 isoform X2 [Toxorhynchites rutilus septentrionalis]|uniref:rhophilin-2 isoform X2 n=1 Tax=Toxorhynchites rutilus septentrionalis TaxID=329112 RepID=UPI00247A0351|nr:rhophilin-2 isoform X2 [Toxorhynchites rutilus septentrionalis]XP_055618283.1 rhophilin-2 isoform X2 [Toxorhynchites rutilus septentrionalis]XP_055618284.1 rhophilin-2 isoform X2 [Toxorhynchites rutilus septentrionalis]XP_055618285.1 rhophilin-2 isoform X2 [Toxorhynchites rutilus septentrionalis]XP_055618286.1 rhophilin-2 isoform X2 [Toxorhynchites rutilus septentrionalis]XP_055618287.1 rhophilin-2 isoform X2 [Toxorhynchites rutilus septentrionalis]XP_055618288.1 rhophilin-2 isoform X2 [To
MGYLQDLQLKGSDPRAATCRGKLQSRRCKLNQEINKELRLRAGAENLFKATTNKKLKDTVALELSFVNSNLQLLKEQLSELNSSMEIYQSEGLDYVIPMIPLGLKETKEVNFMEPFSDFILEHYSENSTVFEDAIADITDTRQAAKTPSRDAQGVALLFRYYNLLYYVERRFFPPDRSLGVYFEWYDSLTGVPSCQRTVAFEKACILFNLAAIYTQIGAKQDRSSENGLDAAVDNFLRAAGVFRHIYDTFTNAPSMDLKPQVLEVLVALMLAQARECLYEKHLLQLEEKTRSDCNAFHRNLSGEATQLTIEYQEIHRIIQSNEAHTYLPECWAGLVPLKSEYYKALAHYHTAKAIDPELLSFKSSTPTKSAKPKAFGGSQILPQVRDTFIFDETTIEGDIHPAMLKKVHLRESLSSHEEAQRLQRMCRELKNKIALTKVLNYALEKTAEELEILALELDESGFLDEDTDLIDVTLNTTSKFAISLTGPDFTAYKIEDPFRKLGPMAIFSARRHWTAPRCIRLHRGSTDPSTGGGTLDRRRYQAGGFGESTSGGSSTDGSSDDSRGKCQCNKTNYYNDVRSCDVCFKDVCNASEANYRRSDALAKKGGTRVGSVNEIQSCNGNETDCFESFGFHVRGDSPVMISSVEINSLADLGGIKEGDFIVELCGIDVKWYNHQQVLKLIRNCTNSLDLKVITPMDRNYLKPMASTHSKGSISTLSGSSSGVSSGAPSPTGTTTKNSKPRSKLGKNRLSSFTSGSWNPFRRTQSLGKIF